MSVADLPFGTQLIGQTDKTLNAILGRLLDGSGMTERHWVTLSIVLAADTPQPQAVMGERVASALHVTAAESGALLADLAQARLVDVADAQVMVTGEGREFHRGIRASVDEIVALMWGEVPEADLAVAGRVLNTVLTNARTELASL